MCELMVVSLNNERLNKLCLYLLSVIDSENSNKDGVGFFCQKEGLVWKSQLAASQITNLGIIIGMRDFGEKSIMSHVRNASLVHKIIDDAHAHPFLSDKYAVAHNGTLELKDEERNKLYDKTKYIDSEIFSIELTKNRKPFLKALEETVNLFYGKFAFLIFDRETSTQYVVRGKTANLYKSEISWGEEGSEKPIGYVINTVSSDLLKALLMLKNIIEMTSHGKVLNYTEPVLLEENSVFVAKTLNVEKLGTVIETAKPTTSAAAWDEYSYERYNVATSPDAYVQVQKLFNFMREQRMSIWDMDNLCYNIFGEALLGLDKEDINDLEAICAILATKNYDKMRKKWGSIREVSKKTSLDLCSEYKLQYPYFLNPLKKVKQVYTEECKKANAIEEPDNETEKEVEDDSDMQSIGTIREITS